MSGASWQHQLAASSRRAKSKPRATQKLSAYCLCTVWEHVEVDVLIEGNRQDGQGEMECILQSVPSPPET